MSNLGQLSPDDLARWRSHRAHILAIQTSPSHYNREEIERAFKESFLLWGEFIERYDLPDNDDDVTLDPNSGAIYRSRGIA